MECEDEFRQYVAENRSGKRKSAENLCQSPPKKPSVEIPDDKPESEDEDENEHAETAPEKPTKIVVSNLPSTVHEEYLELFFENPKKSGGGPVFNIEFDEEEGTAVIEFDEPEAVQRVLSNRPITMMGQAVDVEIYVPEEPKPKCTIEVTGPPDVVSEEQLETLEMYFENERRSGGGDIVDISFDPEKDIVLITFKTEEVAVRVVDKVNHLIKRKKVNVQLHIPETKNSKMKQAKTDTAELAEVEEEPPKCTVKVKGVDKTGSRETLEFYLENKKRSGGGEIELIKSDGEEEDVLYVTFKSPEAAKCVAEREHSLENRTLKASLYVPPKAPPSYEDRVLIKGLNPSTTQDCLFNFIEAKTSFIPERMDYHADQEGVVMVTFQMGKEDLDFGKLEKVIGRGKLENASLKVARVPIPDCIIVSNLIPEVTRDTVEYYFENVRKSGGGTVKKVVMNDDDTCLVYFEDYTVIDKVLERQHTLGNQSLEVKRYQECLGRPEGELAERKLRTPEDIIVQDLDSSLIKFMKTSKTNQDAIGKQLEHSHAKVRWPQEEKGDVILECTITLTTPECFRLVKTWTKDALKNFQDYLKMLVVHKVPVLQDIWQRVIDELKTVSVPNPDAVALYVEKKSGFITIVGNKHVADNLCKTVEEITKKVMELAEKEKQRVKELVTSLKLIETKMLLADKFPNKMESLFPELKVKINQNKNEILFEGMLVDVQAAKVQMFEKKQSFELATVDLGSPYKAGLYHVKQTKDYIVKKLKSKGVTAVWEVTDGKLKVMSSGDEELEKSLDIVQNSVMENTIALKPASRSLMNTEQWATRVQELQAGHAGMCNIIVPEDCSKIHVVTTDDIANEITDNVKTFLRLNTVTAEKVHCSRQVHRLFERFYKGELSKISKDLQCNHVQVTSLEGYGGFEIRGTEDGIEQAKKRLTTLLDRVKKEEHPAEKPGLGNYMQTQKGKDGLNTIETSLGCVVSLKDEEDELYNENIAAFSETDTGVKENFDRKGVTIVGYCKAYDVRNIYTVRGDMTELKVDAFVNPADDKLSLSGGLGRAFVSKGGQQIVKECSDHIKKEGNLGDGEVLVTTAGKLKGQQIIHVMGPVWKGGMHEEEDLLSEAVFKCLMQASAYNLKSVALPAISCGTYGYPYRKATLTIVKSVKNFFREVQDSTVIDVYLCDMKESTISGFMEALGQEFGQSSIRQLQTSGAEDDSDGEIQSMNSDEEEYLSRSANVKPRLPNRDSANGSEVYIGNIKVTVVKGEIAKQKVELIVNTTARNLDLKNGAVSLSLLKCGGQELQQEVNQKYPNGIGYNEIAVTSGCKLGCKSVVHTSLGNWDQAKDKSCIKDLHTLMRNCLKEAERQGLTSVAFPAIGTGNLGYPKDIVAREMFNGVSEFSEKDQPSNVKEARFIVYQKDFTTIKAFEDELKRVASGKGGGKGRKSRNFNPYEDLQTGRKELLQGHRAGEESVYKTLKGDAGSDVYTFGKVAITIVKGDLTIQNADCIVNSSNEELDLNRGFVAKAISQKGGSKLAKEIQKLAPEMKKKRIVVSSAPGMNCKHIIHIVARDTKDEWQNVVAQCLKEAEKRKLKSIAFPALGTTGMAMKASEIAAVMTKAVESFATTNPQYPLDVRYVIYQEAMVADFHDGVRKVMKKGKSSSLQKDVKGSTEHAGSVYSTASIRKKRKKVDPNKVIFVIYALSDDIVQQAKARIDGMLERIIHEKKFSDSIIKKLDENQLAEIRAIATANDLDIKVNCQSGLIEVSGLASNMINASDKIHGIMRDAAAIEQQKNSAALLSNLVQWYYIEITEVAQELTKYEPDLNYKIETAYTSQAPDVKFVADDIRYVLDFKAMEEYEENNKENKVTVIRRDLVKEGTFEQPQSWDTMQGNLRVVTLQQTSQEYQDIAQKFTASVTLQVTVTKIERIQNKTLWSQYMTKKKQLDDQNPPNTKNETMLWHGTAAEAVDNINFHGFNRSYCGKNATAYGDGVYFAVQAAYSASDTYSRPDPLGIKRVYYSRVLTGEYTAGKSGLRVPPPKGGANAAALYDSVVDRPAAPGMYIIFHDTQAYPEYLISFKRG